MDTLTTDEASILTGEEDISRAKLGWLTDSADGRAKSQYCLHCTLFDEDTRLTGCCAILPWSPCPSQLAGGESKRVLGRLRSPKKSAWFECRQRHELTHPDTLGDELVREGSDHTDLGGLGHGVVEQSWGTSVGDCHQYGNNSSRCRIEERSRDELY